MPTSIAEIIVLLGGHVQRCTCLRGDQNDYQEYAVLEVREIKRVSEAKYLKLFGMFIEGDGVFFDGLVAAVANVVLVEVCGKADL